LTKNLLKVHEKLNFKDISEFFFVEKTQYNPDDSIIIDLLFRSRTRLAAVATSRTPRENKQTNKTKQKPSCDYIHPEKQLIWLELII